jgi:hypothetical protein
MTRSIHTYALAMLLGATCAHAAAQTASTGVADPQAPVPATAARPAIDYRTGPAPDAPPDRAWRAANATVGGRNAMRLTMAPAMSMPGHDRHAGMDMGAMQCKAGDGGKKDCCAGKRCTQGDGTCSCCAGMQTKDGDSCHKEGM